MVVQKMEILGDPQSNLAGYGGPADVPTLFEWIVPSEFRHTADKLRLQRSEQIQMMLRDIRTHTDKANEVLSLICPQLHAQRAAVSGHIGSSGAGLSASLRAQIQEAQQNLGADDLGSSLKEKFAAAEEQIEEHMRQLNETKELLNAQIEIDKRVVAQFVGDVAAASWCKAGSNMQYQELCKTEQELRYKMQQARNGDAVTKQLLFDADADLKLLSTPLEEIESEVAASGGGEGGGQGGERRGRVAELLDSMDALVLSVLAVLKECVSVRDELERLQSDQGVAANLYRKVHHERQPREEAIRDFFEVLQPLMNKMQSMKVVLEQHLQQLQGSSGEMRGIQGISDEIKRREEVIAKYSKALQSHARVFAAIREGWMFYTAMGDPIKQTLARAQGFAAARELEALHVTEDIKRRQEERLRDLQEEEKSLEEERVRKEQLRAAEVKEEEKLLEEQRRLRAAHLQQAKEQRQREEAQRAQEEADMEYALHLASSGAQSVVRRSRDRDHQRYLQHQSAPHLDLSNLGTQLPPLMPPPPPPDLSPPDLSPLLPQFLPSIGGGGGGVGLVPSVMRRPKEPVSQGPDTSNDEAIARSLAGEGGTVKKRPVLQVDAGWSQADESLARELAEDLNMTTPDTRSGGGGPWHSRASASNEEVYAAKVLNLLRSSLQTHERRHQSKVYSKCFSGVQMVDWLVETMDEDKLRFFVFLCQCSVGL
jgi:hypothetical protein